jgi:leucyl aminopeptidase
MNASGSSSPRVASFSIAACTLILSAACATQPPPPPPPEISNESVDALIQHLSSDELKGRNPLVEDIALTEDFIAEQFRAAGLLEFPEFPGYQNRFSFEYRPRRNPEATPTTYELQNIIGYIEGTDPVLKNEYILFGAHHDHMGVGGSGEDTIFNGAEDNATGTTAVIALARYFAEAGANKRSLIFTTFTAEERGLVGARHLASNLPIEADQFVAMVNFEMIGKPAPDGAWNLMYLGPEFSTLDEIFQGALDEDSPITLVAPEENQFRYFNASDNAAFHAQGFITMTLASPNSTVDQYAHKPNDHYEFLNIDYLSDVIRAVVDFTEPLVSGEATPERTEVEPSRLSQNDLPTVHTTLLGPEGHGEGGAFRGLDCPGGPVGAHEG